jgi:hypothetical protein
MLAVLFLAVLGIAAVVARSVMRAGSEPPTRLAAHPEERAAAASASAVEPVPEVTPITSAPPATAPEASVPSPREKPLRSPPRAAARPGAPREKPKPETAPPPPAKPAKKPDLLGY